MYRIPAGTDVTIRRETDAPTAWFAHVTRVELTFERPENVCRRHKRLQAA